MDNALLSLECRTGPADRGHKAQRSEGQRATEGDPEKAPGPGSVLREREHQGRHDHVDSDEHVGDCAARLVGIVFRGFGSGEPDGKVRDRRVISIDVFRERARADVSR